MSLVVSLSEIDDRTPFVGTKASLLGVLTNSGFSVPKGFVITSRAYRKFLQTNNLETRILDIYRNIDFDDKDSVKTNSEKIVTLIRDGKIPQDVIDDIRKGYSSFGNTHGVEGRALELIKAGRDQPAVVVRPSPDSKNTFAGLFSSKIDVKGEESILKAIKKVWSLHYEESILYRKNSNINHDMDMAVLIQENIEPDYAGTAIVQKDNIIIESNFGPAELILEGAINPDLFIVKDSFVTERRVGNKQFVLVKDEINGGYRKVTQRENSTKSSLDDTEILKIANLAKKAKDTLNYPQIVEWCVSRGKIKILQTRPHTKSVEYNKAEAGTLQGLSVSNGYTSGKVEMVDSYINSSSGASIGVIGNPIPYASIMYDGLIAEYGSYSSHAAIICRELGKPAIFGASEATKTLYASQKVTIDGFEGAVYLQDEDEEDFLEEVVHTEAEAKKASWIDTPALALSADTALDGSDIVFVDINKVANLLLGSDSGDVSHNAVVNLVKTLKQNCDESNIPLHLIWNNRPDDHVIDKYKNISSVMIFKE